MPLKGRSANFCHMDGHLYLMAARTEIGLLNVTQRQLRSENRVVPKVAQTQEAIERVAVLFQADYARFGYDLEPLTKDKGT